MNKNGKTGLPGFTAEAALGQTSGRYQLVADLAKSLSVSGIVPAKIGTAECNYMGCTPCKNGWQKCCYNRVLVEEECGPVKPPPPPPPTKKCVKVCW